MGEVTKQVGREIDAATEHAARTLLARLFDRHSIIAAYLYGSRARGTHRPDSDADMAVILAGAEGDRWAAARDMADVAFDVLLETGVLVEALPLWEEEFEPPEVTRNPALLRAIRSDGILL